MRPMGHLASEFHFRLRWFLTLLAWLQFRVPSPDPETARFDSHVKTSNDESNNSEHSAFYHLKTAANPAHPYTSVYVM
jgi:hypothetical protein